MYAIYAVHPKSFCRNDDFPARDCRPTSTTHMPPSKAGPEGGESKLQQAVDVLLRDHQERLPPPKVPEPPQRVTHRDSYSTITTAPGAPDSTNCVLRVDANNKVFIPLEISFPSSDAHHLPAMPKMQNSRASLHWRDVYDMYGDDFDDDDESCEDIVFVPVEADLATRSSSMEVIRKLSSNSSDAAAEGGGAGWTGGGGGATTPPPPPPSRGLRRAPSDGEKCVAPPPPSRPLGNNHPTTPHHFCRVEI